MRTLGILGGMSHESTLEYYRRLNRDVAARMGGLHSAPLLIHSFDFAGIAALLEAERWDALGETLGQAALNLARAGAQGMVIATNTMHLVADEVARVSGLPVLHIAKATGAAARRAGCSRVGLLGTRFTMETGVYADVLKADFGLSTLIPDEPDRAFVHEAIFGELVRGVFADSTRARFREIMARLAEAGAEGVILGCTEIPLLIGPDDAAMPLFDTTALHCDMAVDWMLS
ncbi:aspartate racemase [Alkalidesulfovibrio alkalitolerans DSM 16529]|uniref:Aspartate racemase n=1 Tax=Alkalidesulfovibrio alkalitolerans DSM 16529 TaxID=1121439 RepID=S7TG84_9BACT|nr:amino acid racemase [Alkalidesulfovibrio alkalitolerans]EPR36222.1 aspartate racemase [Alkalidesulfovibrio alkalitolerans DSM 16529]